jgi:hypothetical protein
MLRFAEPLLLNCRNLDCHHDAKLQQVSSIQNRLYLHAVHCICGKPPSCGVLLQGLEV